MIPNGTSYAQFPSFANNGTKTPPGGSPESAKYALGMVPADTFPAEWANYLFHGATAGITRLNQDTNSIKKELNTILSEYGITNDASAYDQLVGALAKIFPQVCTCSTAAATAAKSVALTGYTRKVGAIFVIEMTNGNTVANPTLTINSEAESTAPICDANGAALGSGAWKGGDTITVLYTGSKYIMATQGPVDALENGNKRPVTSDAVYQAIKNQFDMMWPVGVVYTQYPKQKSPNELWGNYSTWQLLDYGGAFFRSSGGNADAFEKSLSVSSVNGTTITFSSAHGLNVGSVIYDFTLNEGRTVTSVTNTTTVVVNAIFTNTNLRNVLIGQLQGTAKNGLSAGFAGANVNVSAGSIKPSMRGVNSPFTTGSYIGWNYMTNQASNETKQLNFNYTPQGTVTVSSSDAETRPSNLTCKIWVRTA